MSEEGRRGREREREGERERERERERESLNHSFLSTHCRSLLKRLRAHDTDPHEFGQVFIRTVCKHTTTCTCTHAMALMNLSASIGLVDEL